MEITNGIEQIKELTFYLNDCRNKYYNYAESSITDLEYDNLLEELDALEKASGFRLQNSPTIKVGFQVLDTLPRAKHPTPLLSANKTKSLEDLVAFAYKGKCIASVKCDGLTTNIYVENGKIIKGVTRGDGEIGQDISHNIKFISNLPNQIKEIESLRITGESVIFEEDFNEMKDNIVNSSGVPFSNPRNMASGSLTLVDNKKFAERKVKFIAFNIENGFEGIDSLEDCYIKLSKLGFTVVPYTIVPENVTIEQMKEITEGIRDCAKKLGLPNDGVILRYDSRSYSKKLGRTEKFYKDMIAYKFENEWYNTIFKDIEWNISRNGYVIPTAIFEEVEIEGVKISRATLNNINFINDLKLHKGDLIAVSRRNEVIPYVEKNLSEHTETSKDLIPSICPCCGTPLKEIREGVLYCPNTENCKEQIIGKISHFASKSSLNIEGLSKATIEVLVNNNCITSIKDLYYLKDNKDKILSLKGFGEKSYNKLINSIENSRKTTLDKFINGLGISNVGKTVSKILAKFYNYDFEDFYKEGISQIIEDDLLKEVGYIISTSIKEYFRKEKETQNLKELAKEFTFETPLISNNEIVNSIFSNKKFCISGTFTIGKRSDLQQKIENLGGTFVSGVTKNTDFLIAGEKCGSKLDKALKLGTKIINEIELKKILEN